MDDDNIRGNWRRGRGHRLENNEGNRNNRGRVIPRARGERRAFSQNRVNEPRQNNDFGPPRGGRGGRRPNNRNQVNERRINDEIVPAIALLDINMDPPPIMLNNNTEGSNQEYERDENQRQRIKRIKVLCFNDLNRIYKMEVDEMLGYITTKVSGFPNALENERHLKDTDFISSILKILNKAFNSEFQPSAINYLLMIVKESKFLKNYLQEFYINMLENTQHNPIAGRMYKDPIKDSFSLLKEILKRLPSSYMMCVQLFSLVEGSVRVLRTSMNCNIIDQEIEDSLKELKEQLETIPKQFEMNNATTTKPLFCDKAEVTNVDPPNDFRDMSIFPDLQLDILSQQTPFLREIKIKGPYRDVDDYLDIYFRLLREDFIRPLRIGINDFLSLGNNRGRKRLADIQVYYNIHILNPVCMPNGIHYRIKFDVSMFKKLKWEYSKRLIYGSLVCLSSNNFTDFYIATISDRKTEDLKSGNIVVKFETRNLEIRNIDHNINFTMVETSAYFEAFRHNLEALKKITEKDIPFSQQIVYCNREVLRPEYLLMANEPVYDMKLKMPTQKQVNEQVDVSTLLVKNKGFKCKIMDKPNWPNPEKLSLDQAQLTALMTALTTRLSIIQGPPGTGKTFIGLQIVSYLLQNSEFWSTKESKPILVVCYTNHALDQFLEGIYKFQQEGIVRVGSRSKSEILSKLTLSSIKMTDRENKQTPRDIFIGSRNLRDNIRELQNDIEQFSAHIESSEKGILSEDVLDPFMLGRHREQIHMFDNANQFHYRNPIHKSKMLNWLFNFEDQYYNNEDKENSGDEILIDDLVELDYEAEIEQRKRLEELDYDYEKDYRQKRKKYRLRL